MSARFLTVLEGVPPYHRGLLHRDVAAGVTLAALAIPWYLVHTDDKTRGRLNIITHLLTQVPYEPIKKRKIVLPKRQPAKGCVAPAQPLRFIPTPF